MKNLYTPSSRLCAGEWVQVRTREEILGTLDANGRLDELPFMPEMLQYCGMKLKVGKRAHKTCDPALGEDGRKMTSTVFLEGIRCNGSAHDACEAACLIFWKEAWLKPVDREPTSDASLPNGHAQCSEEDLYAGVKIPLAPGESEPTYVCQNTRLRFATQPLGRWDVRQYLEDYASGNVRISQLAAGLLFTIWKNATDAGIGLGFAMRWIYDTFQRAVGGTPYPLLRPLGVPRGGSKPITQLGLQEGDLVRVKSYAEILATLDSNYRNRGLYFDPEMVSFTERTYQVQARLKQIIDERTGKMVRFKTDAIVLKNVVCQARYSKCRRFCPRAIYPFWREIWLERVADSQADKN
jgi:hypothetical protein